MTATLPPSTSTTDLIVIGAGGNVADIVDIVERVNSDGHRLQLVGLLDDHVEVGAVRYGHGVLGPLSDWRRHVQACFLSSIRNDAMHYRHEAIIEALGIADDRWASLVHPSANVSRRASIGRGVYVCSGASIAAGAQIDDHASIGPGAIVGHDSRLQEYAIVAAGAVVGGRVDVGRACYVGSGSALMPNVTIGDRALIGLGAVVITDITANHVVIGNPARTLRVRDQG